jgi:hypothetical protein
MIIVAGKACIEGTKSNEDCDGSGGDFEALLIEEALSVMMKEENFQMKMEMALFIVVEPFWTRKSICGPSDLPKG